MLKLNSRGNWEYKVNGKVLASSKSKESCVEKLRTKFGIEVDDAGVANETPSLAVAEKTSEFSINERFAFLQHFVKMIAKDQAHALFISGPGGLGKTHTVMDTLAKCGKTEDGEEGDFIVVKGFTTAKMLYRTFYENNGKIIIYDDADSAFRDPVSINILKGALDSGDRRIISWNAEFSDREDLPNRFEFTGAVIFISNFDMKKVPQALISRCMKVSLDMTREEKVTRIETVMQEDSFGGGICEDIKNEVVAFIRKYANEFTDLNVRTALNIVKIRASLSDSESSTFERLAKYMAVA